MQDLLKKVKEIAVEAGIEIMAIYNRDFQVEYKADSSPLTEADKAANEIICRNLREISPEIPILSEENKEVAFSERKGWTKMWVVDPIDGTKEFIKKNGEFTVNIALVENGVPIMGVVYAPALKNLYYASHGEGAFKDGEALPLLVNETPEKSLTVVASRSHMSSETESFVNKLKTNTAKVTIVSKGSSLKLCLVAEGTADYYPRLAPTIEWDTAAAHAIVLEAGKKVLEYETDKALKYNKENLLNPWFVVK